MLTVDGISAGGGVAAGGKLVFPEELSVAFVEGVELFILAAADKDQSPGGDDGAAEILGAGGGDAFGGQLGELAQANLPGEIAGVEVDRGQQAPGRLDGRIVLLVVEIAVAGQVVALAAGLFHSGDDGRFVGIDVKPAGGGIEGCARPGGTAVEAGSDNGAAHRRRFTLVAVAKFRQSLEDILMAFGGDGGGVLFGEGEAREGRRLEWRRLSERCFFARHIRRRRGDFLHAK